MEAPPSHTAKPEPVVVIEESEGKGRHRRSISGARNFFAGGCGGVCGITIGHPFDTIKVRLQTAPLPKAGEEPLFRGTLDCVTKTIRNEGVTGLFKGLLTPFSIAVPLVACNFWTLTLGRKIQMSNPHRTPTNFQNFTSGILVGASGTILVIPGERIKCLLQVQQGSAGERKYKGPFDCAKQLYKQKGVRSLYRGACATLLRDVPSFGLYYFSYEWILNHITVEGESRANINPLRILLAGGTAGIIFWTFALPMDVLKSRIQIAPEGTYPRGVRDAFRHLIKKEGIASLYKGVIPVITRAFPANAGLFLGYEAALSFFDWVSPE